MPPKTDFRFLSQGVDNKVHITKNTYRQWIITAICVIFFLGIAVYQARFLATPNIGGFFVQIQVLISVFLTIYYKRLGYLTALILNFFLAFSIAFSLITQSDLASKPGILVPLITILIITIIYLFIISYHKKIDEITIKNEHLAELNEKLATAHEEMEQQNELLKAYNRIIKENEEQLSYLAFMDMLTELPNRKMIINRIDQLTTSVEEPDLRFAVAFIDLDDFKQVNDTMGHHIGDLLLRVVAQKLSKAIHPDDILGRLGGDEFALIIKTPLKKEEISTYIEGLRRMLIEDILIEDQPFSVHASFGVSLYPRDGRTSAELLKSADNAMYKAKAHKKIGIEFCADANERVPQEYHEMDFDSHFSLALERSEFYFVFQPQYISQTKHLRGFEVLTRWHSPELGDVSPAQFIPLAEKNGLMTLFGQWILHEACTQLEKIQTLYPCELIMTVNISTVELLDSAFVPMVKNILKRTGISGTSLEFDISESVFLSAGNQVLDILTELKYLGIQIALDDFGAGITYLDRLEKLPIDTLKIDRTFINDISAVKKIESQPVASMIALGHEMNMAMVAKGVETPFQLEYLKNHHCDCIQGYLWGNPLTADDFHHLLDQPLFPKRRQGHVAKPANDVSIVLPLN